MRRLFGQSPTITFLVHSTNLHVYSPFPPKPVPRNNSSSRYFSNMAHQGEEDLVASKTEGFKLGDKKTVEEYAKLGEL